MVGEIGEVNFGFTNDLCEELIDKVNVIYHIAATIKFSSPLRAAIKTNLTGTMHTIELAKKVKNLAAYVYYSTAFCNSNNRGLILEKVYKSKFDPYDMMRWAEDDNAWLDFNKDKCKATIMDHPNTYTFTKNLAENLLMAEMKNMPVAVVRPSVGKCEFLTPIINQFPSFNRRVKKKSLVCRCVHLFLHINLVVRLLKKIFTISRVKL